MEKLQHFATEFDARQKLRSVVNVCFLLYLVRLEELNHVILPKYSVLVNDRDLQSKYVLLFVIYVLFRVYVF